LAIYFTSDEKNKKAAMAPLPCASGELFVMIRLLLLTRSYTQSLIWHKCYEVITEEKRRAFLNIKPDMTKSDDLASQTNNDIAGGILCGEGN
jgi:hypothetical protein